MILLAFIAAVVAFGLLGLATDAHHGRWLRARPSGTRKRLMRRGAWCLIAVCLLLSIAARGLVFGPVAWVGLVMLGAAVAFLVINLLVPRARRVQHPSQHVHQERQP
ncbi:DUF3325 domain-containing protein [Sphingomonas arantia]|uniref:DUF3325 domain-containing protein n=1 Tax=Sphingomonas arantia TaxID=1460676 RepID=A0ABW4U159_9SPHN